MGRVRGSGFTGWVWGLGLASVGVKGNGCIGPARSRPGLVIQEMSTTSSRQSPENLEILSIAADQSVRVSIFGLQDP